MIGIGVPLKNPSPLVMPKIIELLSRPGITQIHVSINPPFTFKSHFESLQDLGIRVSIQPRDIGLYGNFRFLANTCTEEFFAWQCFDDSLSVDLHEFAINYPKETGLIIPSWVWQEIDGKTLKYFDEQIEGTYPNLESISNRVYSSAKAEPSWIFGLWRTNFLNNIFPKKDFDWLDLYLLQTAIRSNKVKIGKTSTPTVIGTWKTTSKIPYAVRQGRPNPSRIILEMLNGFPWACRAGLKPAYIWSRQIVLIIRLTCTLRWSYVKNSRRRGVR